MYFTFIKILKSQPIGMATLKKIMFRFVFLFCPLMKGVSQGWSSVGDEVSLLCDVIFVRRLFLFVATFKRGAGGLKNNIFLIHECSVSIFLNLGSRC